MTSQFETSGAQNEITTASNTIRDEVFRVYQGFREINTRAEALKHAFRPWRVSQYFEAIDDFQKRLRGIAERLARER